jgi:protein SCO1
MSWALAVLAAGLLAQHEHHHTEPEQPAEASSDSLYNLKTKWTDSSGKKVALGDFKGQPVVLAMIYASCQTVCPLIVSDVKRIHEALPESVRGKVRLVLVSFDPARDTPRKLARYAQDRGLNGKQWTLLTADPESVRDLAALLGMRYRPIPGGDFAHSNLITVLDAQGAIVHRYEGVGQDVAPVVKALVSAPAAR